MLWSWLAIIYSCACCSKCFCNAMPLSALFLGLHAMETPLCTCCLPLAPPALCPRHRHSHFCILWDLSQEEASSRLCVPIIVMSCCRLASLSLPEATTVLPGLLSNFIPLFFFYFFLTSTHNELIICRQCHIYHRPPVMSVHTKPMKVKSALSVYLFSLFVCVFCFLKITTMTIDGIIIIYIFFN